MLNDKRISLDPRLSKIAEMLDTCSSCADIGSDHGRLGAFLLQSRAVEHMCLTDISEPSLNKARRLIRLLELEDQTSFYVGDGAQMLDEAVDAAVIAGMGGETIAHIVETSQGRLNGARLLLQPNVAAPELRRRLNAAGWMVEDEVLVRDGRRIYLIVAAVQGKQQLSNTEYEVGPVLLSRRPELFDAYCEFHLHVARKALSGAERGGDDAAIAALRQRIEIWEGI